MSIQQAIKKGHPKRRPFLILGEIKLSHNEFRGLCTQSTFHI